MIQKTKNELKFLKDLKWILQGTVHQKVMEMIDERISSLEKTKEMGE